MFLKLKIRPKPDAAEFGAVCRYLREPDQRDWAAREFKRSPMNKPLPPDLRALATDFDGTLAHDGTVNGLTLNAIKRLKEAHFRLILATGRELHELRAIFPQITWFDLAVMENGGVLFHPHTGEVEALAAPPPSEFVARLHERGLPLQVGKVIVATWEPHENEVLQTIKEMGLELQVIFNKGAVMILPSGVNKATGLRAAAERLALPLAQIRRGRGRGERSCVS